MFEHILQALMKAYMHGLRQTMPWALLEVTLRKQLEYLNLVEHLLRSYFVPLFFDPSISRIVLKGSVM